MSKGIVENINETGAMELRLEAVDGGYDLWLDDKRLHHIENYRIEKTENTPSGPYAELSIKMLVCYPATQVTKDKIVEEMIPYGTLEARTGTTTKDIIAGLLSFALGVAIGIVFLAFLR